MDTSINPIQLFQILKLKLGDKEAEALVSFVEAKIKEENEHNLKTLATKEDLAKMETKFTVLVVGTKAEMIKWMFVFWIGTISILTGIMIALFHAYIK